MIRKEESVVDNAYAKDIPAIPAPIIMKSYDVFNIGSYNLLSNWFLNFLFRIYLFIERLFPISKKHH